MTEHFDYRVVLSETVEPLGQIRECISGTRVKDGLEDGDKASANVDISQTDFIVHNPFHIVSEFLVLEMLIKFHCNFLGSSQSFRVLLLINILGVAQNWQQRSVHYGKPLGLTPGDPFVDLGFLELSVAI